MASPRMPPPEVVRRLAGRRWLIHPAAERVGPPLLIVQNTQLRLEPYPKRSLRIPLRALPREPKARRVRLGPRERIADGHDRLVDVVPRETVSAVNALVQRANERLLDEWDLQSAIKARRKAAAVVAAVSGRQGGRGKSANHAGATALRWGGQTGCEGCPSSRKD